MAWGFLSKLASAPVKEIIEGAGKGVGSVMNRFGFTEKLSEAERIDKYSTLFKISEDSTDSARQMAMMEMRTQKSPWIIRTMNGLVRPCGGLLAIFCEAYSILGSNIEAWAGIKHVPINISTESHIVLGTIIAFYFGSRLKETLSGVTIKR